MGVRRIPKRAAQTRLRGRSVDAVDRRARDGAPFCVTMRPTSRHGSVRCPVHWVRPALCPRDRSTGAPKTCLYQRHTTSDRGMDCTPGQRHSLGLKPRATRSAISERARSLNGIFYTYEEAANGRRCPRILPPKSTMHDYLELWNWDVTLECVHHTLYVAVREQAGREASPTAASSIRRAQRVPKRGSWLDPSGYDAARRGRRDGPPVERGRSSR
jgi:hypothetical protein